ncbi:MAG: DNA helicase UvrD [Candidatus Cryptobacteroides sp.]
MDKRLILAVAGSGKTTCLIRLLNLDQRFLLLTYTRNNYEHLKVSVIKKFGYLPENIKILSYFQFVYSFCFNPFCGLKNKANGITFNLPPDYTRYKTGTNEFYRTKGGLLYHNRIAHFCNENYAIDIKKRLDKYYDYFLVDEVQDFGGHDFDLLLSILPDRGKSVCVGDFFQHTYDTSRDGNVNKSLYKSISTYINQWKKLGVVVDTTSLSKTRRCCAEICQFVNKMGIAIESTEEAVGSVQFIDNQEECERIINNQSIPKLFYSEGNKYRCVGMNWGASKGIDRFLDVCVVLNKKTYDLYSKGNLQALNPTAKNKLYVACTRAHRHLYLMSYKWLENYKRK